MIPFLPDKMPDIRKFFDFTAGKRRVREGDIFFHPEDPEVFFVAIAQCGKEIHIFNHQEKRMLCFETGERYPDLIIAGHIWEPKARRLLN